MKFLQELLENLTYDHASSLGRNELDERREKRLYTKDSSFSVEAYVNKCQSCLYAKVEDRKPLKESQ